MTPILIFVGAMLGAPARYLTDRALNARHDSPFPWGTFAVNLSGCLILGALTGAAAGIPVVALLGTGFCGALTTYSTFSFETLRLLEQRAYFYATMNVVVSVIAGLGAALLGFTVAHALLG
ncbi:fluoride efflux transporter CrcB [Nocardia macrotermitis]|uniref:Fluoride-specific ion channel FluC n=1 Tax=Nocardia macrotermitis TaxID=2585198 RepID=A0A7K0DE44_9NOCA|nr:fluoride efflux transporter CrcB [Nocardia macrotermitis]MQY24073.1 putative fluoride ion transporter CrcB [Nocardia macrotermitis]